MAPADGSGQGSAATTRGGERVIVRVVDRGPGIPPAQLERVFEPFYRAGTSGGGHRGSGLGLAIARGFTEANAGTLQAESLPGQGASFVFELPLAELGQPAGEPDRPIEQLGEPTEQVPAATVALAASVGGASPALAGQESGA